MEVKGFNGKISENVIVDKEFINESVIIKKMVRNRFIQHCQ